MKNQLVANGYWRLRRGQRAANLKTVQEPQGGNQPQPDENPDVQKRRLEEAIRREKMAAHKPSAGALW